MPRVPNTGERRLLKSIRLKGLLPPPTDISLTACLAPPGLGCTTCGDIHHDIVK